MNTLHTKWSVSFRAPKVLGSGVQFVDHKKRMIGINLTELTNVGLSLAFDF